MSWLHRCRCGRTSARISSIGYPRGPLLQALATRILRNFYHVEEHAPSLSASHDTLPYADTQLLISLLGVIVFPHERSAEALGKLLDEYGRLDQILTIQHPRGIHNGKLIELSVPARSCASLDAFIAASAAERAASSVRAVDLA